MSELLILLKLSASFWVTKPIIQSQRLCPFSPPWASSSAAPFQWSPSGFVYFGKHITPSLSGLCKAHFIPLIHKMKEDLAHWTSLPLSLIGRVHLFQMNILPRLLYVFKMVPVLLTRQSLSILNSSLQTGQTESTKVTAWPRRGRAVTAKC